MGVAHRAGGDKRVGGDRRAPIIAVPTQELPRVASRHMQQTSASKFVVFS